MIAQWRQLLPIVLACGATTFPAAANSSLQPFQMVRSLQVVQDRLADGDHAALPMQRKILEMIDERLRTASPDEFEDRRNFRALLIYGMSGGNPTTLKAAMSRLKLEDADRRLGEAIVDYLQGNAARALASLQAVDISGQPEEIIAFLSLIKGSVIIAEKPKDGFALFDRARLLAPGTLVEEAALRRTIGLAAQQKDAERFLRASSQYVRRFLRSPYASNFADSFVAGVLDLHDEVDLVATKAVIDDMQQDQARVVYLRIARRAAIEGHDRLVEFARQGLEGHLASKEAEPDPRAVLYDSLASVTSDQVGTVRERLEGIDRNALSASDRDLLDAAISVVAKVTTEPALPDASQAATELAPNDAGPGTTAGETTSVAPLETIVETVPPGAEGRAAPAEARNDPATAFVSAARQRLQEVDDLLGETKP